jgi:hypothetical protein
MHSVSDVRKIEVLTAEPLVHGSSRLEVEIVIAKVKMCRWVVIKLPGELIQAGDKTLRSAIHKIINSIRNKGELIE